MLVTQRDKQLPEPVKQEMTENRKRFPRWAKTSVGLAVVAALMAFAVWRALEPKIHTATEAEIDTVLPVELRLPDPVDPVKQARFKTLFSLFPGSIPMDSRDELSGVPIADGINFWADDPNAQARVTAALDAGPIQFPPVSDADPASRKMIQFIMEQVISFTMRSESLADRRDFKGATRQLLLTLKLVDKLIEASGWEIYYGLVSSIAEIEAEAIRHVAGKRDFPAESCRQLLDALTPAPDSDLVLVASIRSEFRRLVLPSLEDPVKNWKKARVHFGDVDVNSDANRLEAGTYDPIPIAKIYGEVLTIALANTGRPLSKFDSRGEVILKKEAGELPYLVYDPSATGFRKLWANLKYRFEMDNGKNTVGRQILSFCIYGEDLSEQLSCRWRTMRSAARVLLASRIYRASHAGALPSSIYGFVPILGQWPQDRYVGKPMLYDAKKEVVYAVGTDFKDDGGDVGPKVGVETDVGLSLKLK